MALTKARLPKHDLPVCIFEPQIWPAIVTSPDAESTCFKGSRTSCDVIFFGIFWPRFGQKRSHHVMDAFCRENPTEIEVTRIALLIKRS